MSESHTWQTETDANPTHSNSGVQIDILKVILHQKWLILFFGAIGLGIGYFQYSKLEPVYSSNAKVLVSRIQNQIPVDGISTVQEKKDPLKSHTEVIRSPSIITRAVEIGNLNKEPSLAGNKNLAGVISGRLSVYRSSDQPDMIRLSYTSTNRNECEKVLKAVVLSYMKFIEESQSAEIKKAINLINQAKDTLAVKIKERREDYAKFRETAKLLFKGNEGLNFHQQRLSEIESQRSSLTISNSQLQAEIDSITNAIKNGTSREVIMLMLTNNMASNNDDDGTGKTKNSKQSSFTKSVFPLLLEKEMMMEKLGPDHPKVKAIEKQIQITRSLLDQQQAENPIEDGPKKAKPDFILVYLDALKQEIVANNQKAKQLNDLYKLEEVAAKELMVDEMKNTDLQDEINRVEMLYDQIVDRIQEINLFKESDILKAQEIFPPSKGSRIYVAMQQYLGMGMVGGVFVGMIFGYLLEMADKSYRSPDEISKHIGVPVIGHIPELPTEQLRKMYSKRMDANYVHPTLVTYHQPRSTMSESYRSVRSALYFSTRGKGHQLIQVTSPNPSDGKSTMAANLAVTIAQSGKKCLLIDCDLRRPKVHTFFNLDRSIGMTSLLVEDDHVTDVIQSTAIDNLWCVSAGPKNDNPSELIASAKFEELLDIFCQKYDFVILDTPPLLVVTDSAAVSARADGVILALKVDRKSQPNAMRCREILDHMGANIMGIVVNGVGFSSTYNYGYGRYYNNYKYGNYNKSYTRYYEEDDSPDAVSMISKKTKKIESKEISSST